MRKFGNMCGRAMVKVFPDWMIESEYLSAEEFSEPDV